MKIEAKINYVNKSQSGKPTLDFICKDCGRWYVGENLDAFFWQSLISKQNLETAVAEFIERLNTQKVHDIYPKRTTGNKLVDRLCNCDPNVVDIDHVRAVKRAKAILEAATKKVIR